MRHREVAGRPGSEAIRGAPRWAVMCLGAGTPLLVGAAVGLAVVGLWR